MREIFHWLWLVRCPGADTPDIVGESPDTAAHVVRATATAFLAHLQQRHSLALYDVALNAITKRVGEVRLSTVVPVEAAPPRYITLQFSSCNVEFEHLRRRVTSVVSRVLGPEEYTAVGPGWLLECVCGGECIWLSVQCARQFVSYVGALDAYGSRLVDGFDGIGELLALQFLHAIGSGARPFNAWRSSFIPTRMNVVCWEVLPYYGISPRPALVPV